jgi:hypothetical protein
MQEPILFPPFAVILLTTFFALVYLADRLFHEVRWQKIRLVLGSLVCAIGIWTLGDFLRMVTPPSYADLWASVRFLGICPVGGLWFLLAYLYTGGRWRSIRKWLPLIFLPAVLSYTLLLTNTWHHLFFKESLALFPENQVFGPVYWVHTFFSYLLLGMGILLYIFSYFNTSEKIYRKQTLIMILGCLVPLLGNVLYIFRIVPVAVDTTPLLFFITVVLYGIGVYRFSMADLRPIAMETILANIRSGILILDHSGHVVGTNPHFYDLFDLRCDVVGFSMEELLQEILPQVRNPDPFRTWAREIRKSPNREDSFSLDLNLNDRAIDLTYTHIFEDQRVPLGGILVLHDMTDWKILNRSLENDRLELSKKNEQFLRMNEELRKKNEELERFNRFAVAREMKMIELKRRLKEREPEE